MLGKVQLKHLSIKFLIIELLKYEVLGFTHKGTYINK